MYIGAGELFESGLVLADYWYRWTEGHAGRFFLAVCPRARDGEPFEGAGVAVIAGGIVDTNLVYSVVEPEDSPWADFGAFGPVLSRAAVLTIQWQPGVFELVDAVSAKEPRLSSRISNAAASLN